MLPPLELVRQTSTDAVQTPNLIKIEPDSLITSKALSYWRRLVKLVQLERLALSMFLT